MTLHASRSGYFRLETFLLLNFAASAEIFFSNYFLFSGAALDESLLSSLAASCCFVKTDSSDQRTVLGELFQVIILFNHWGFFCEN